MKRILIGMLALTILITLTGCFQFPQPEGVIRITLNPNRIATKAIQPKTIPANADYVRMRIWHQASPENIVKTFAVEAEAVVMEVALPAKMGYIVDVVSYDWDGRLLTGDRATEVSVTSGETTSVGLVLTAWGSGCSGDIACEALASSSVSFNLTGGGGLVQDCFGSAALVGSYISFQDTSMDHPHGALAAGDISNGTVSLKAMMPDIDVEAIFYSVASIRMIDAWSDRNSPDRIVNLHMELPNRFMGETIHEILVTPPSGGIDVTIE